MTNEAKHERELKKLERELKAWRNGPRAGGRIPEPLWTRAVSLAAIHGQWKTTRRLNLNYYALKKRCEATAATAKPTKPVKRRRAAKAATPSRRTKPAKLAPVAGFVELPLAPTASGPECFLELERDGGSRLRVGLRGAGIRQLETVARMLWELGR
jgi:hypothetical protein